MSIQRYNVVYDEAPNSYYPKLVIVESDEGRWVRQEDAHALELALASERLKVEKLKEIACNCEPMIGFTCPLHDGSWDKSQENPK